jgi:hypothetical protein
MSASRGSDAANVLAPNSGTSVNAADADRKSRREIVMTWFPKFYDA